MKKRLFKRGDIIERVKGDGKPGEKARFLDYMRRNIFGRKRISIRYLGHAYYDSEHDIDYASNFKLGADDTQGEKQ